MAKGDVHKKAAAERQSEEDAIKASYIKIAKEPAMQDVITKLKELVGYHEKIAKDGVGYKNVTNADGVTNQELIYFTPEKRLGELDRAAGIEEGLSYIERRLT